MEPLVDAQQRVKEDDDELGGEIEPIETRSRVKPRRVVDRAVSVRDSRTKSGTEGEQGGRGEEDPNLMAETTITEFIHLCLRDYHAEDDDGNGEECEEGEPRDSNENNFVVFR